MPKPRRKSEIRAAALHEVAALRKAAELRAAFLKPRPRSWHDVFLATLKSGRPVSAAAEAAGVSRSGAYKARMIEPGFRAAWDTAVAAAWAEERQKRAAARRGHWRTRIAAPDPTAQRRDRTVQRENATLRHDELGPQKVDGLAVGRILRQYPRAGGGPGVTRIETVTLDQHRVEHAPHVQGSSGGRSDPMLLRGGTQCAKSSALAPPRNPRYRVPS